MLSNVTTKGQVTIPSEIRNRFQIRPNDRVDFFIDGERIIITPVRSLKQLRGSITTLGTSTFVKEREEAKRTVAERITGETA